MGRQVTDQTDEKNNEGVNVAADEIEQEVVKNEIITNDQTAPRR